MSNKRHVKLPILQKHSWQFHMKVLMVGGKLMAFWDNLSQKASETTSKAMMKCL